MDETKNIISKKDFLIGTVIVIIMATIFTIIGGLPLIVTFVVSLLFTWIAFLYLFIKKTTLPSLSSFLPFYFITFAWQFIHFNEEFYTGFRIDFPHLYSVSEYSATKFVTINMLSYFVFTVTCVLAFKKRLNFLLVPVLFYIVYGAIGNAIAHTWWSIYSKGYFPGFYTAQVYWILGPLVLYKLFPSKKMVAIFIILYALVMIPMLTFFAK
ncbi:hypothetical protein CLV51_10585 [Chitinophaga niastensis]|uniref:HXXEE domain-containing protein n=1 Tax=Chitinophaga niastensis TaxID=536980 RepID=A0A2P8HER8_CHINA|nr:hypothetical protein [Chitinophaga niastensis]PSL44713.1 hypothetical protein CLV51_10585 [Chitinophaga niastensis]